LTRGGIFNDRILQIYCWVCQWKNFEWKPVSIWSSYEKTSGLRSG